MSGSMCRIARGSGEGENVMVGPTCQLVGPRAVASRPGQSWDVGGRFNGRDGYGLLNKII